MGGVSGCEGKESLDGVEMKTHAWCLDMTHHLLAGELLDHLACPLPVQFTHSLRPPPSLPQQAREGDAAGAGLGLAVFFFSSASR